MLGAAFAARREGRPAPPTIYGRFEYELALSMGPVPVSFTHEPQNNVPAHRAQRPPMPWTPPSRTGTPAGRVGSPAIGAGVGVGVGVGVGIGAGGERAVPTRSATSPPIQGEGMGPGGPALVARANTFSPPMGSHDPVGRRNMMSPPTVGGPNVADPVGRANTMSPAAGHPMDPVGRQHMRSPPMQVPGPARGVTEPIARSNTVSPPYRGPADPISRSNTTSPSLVRGVAGSAQMAGITAQIDQVLAGAGGGAGGPGPGQPIPRANFAPTVGGVRPRSRSFSGMTSGGTGLSIRTDALTETRYARNMF